MPGPGYAEPHRGVLILVLGILGLVVCVICGIVAWVMGNSDLQAIRAGRMDPAGEQMTNIGRILGIVSVALAVFGAIIGGLMMAFGMMGAMGH